MSDYDALLRHLSAGLILKCCVMYTALDHEIGCGGDHMIGNFLEKRHKLPHGQSVFYGAILVAMLFPEWAKFGLSEEDLLKSGLNTSLLDLEVFKIILQTISLINKAVSSRPERMTVLRDIKAEKMEKTRLADFHPECNYYENKFRQNKR